MAFLAESYNTSTIDVPLTERLIGQTWTAGQDANINSIKLYTGLYEDYVHRNSSYDWNNEYERLLIFVPGLGGTGFYTYPVPDYIGHYHGTRNAVIPTGSRFMVDVRHSTTTTPGTIRFTITNVAGSETIIEDHAIPVYAGADEIVSSFLITTLTTVDWDDAQISYSVISGAITPLQIYLFPIFPVTANVRIAIHEVDEDGNISQSPIDNGVSASLSASAWTSTSAQRTFTFSTPPYVKYGQKYVFVVQYEEFFYETTQFNNSSIFVEADDTTLGYANGEGYIYESGEWGDSPTYGETDLRFEIWYEDTVTPPATLDWPTDCIEQIATMSDIVATIQSYLDTMSAMAASEYTVSKYETPNETTFASEWVRDDRALPLDEDFQYQWFDKNTNAFGGKYKYIKDDIFKNENEHIRGNTQRGFPYRVSRNVLMRSAAHYSILSNNWDFPFYFDVKYPSKLYIEMPYRSFTMASTQHYIHWLNGARLEDLFVSAYTLMPTVTGFGMSDTFNFVWMHPRVLHPGEYVYQLGLTFGTPSEIAAIGGGILVPQTTWMGFSGSKPTNSVEVVNLWLYQV